MQSVIKGFLLGIWVVGTGMIIVPMMRVAIRGLARRRRLRTLGRPFLKPSAYTSFEEMKVVRHLKEEMEIAGMNARVHLILALMLILVFIGFFGSDAAVRLLQQRFALEVEQVSGFHVWLLSSVIAILFGSLPYFYVRFRAQHKRQRIANRMIMIVQNLIGHYRPSLTLTQIIVHSSKTMPEEVKNEWRRLELSLHMQSAEEALYQFAERINNEWADDLADLLLIGTHYGTDISESLHHLVSRMQAAKRHEENRLAMISVYRLGTSFMVVFAFFIVGFNIYADGANYSHYFIDPTGKMLLSVSFAVMFASMVLVIRSGQKAF